MAKSTSATNRRYELLWIVRRGNQDALLGSSMNTIKSIQQTIQRNLLVHSCFCSHERNTALPDTATGGVQIIYVFEQYNTRCGDDSLQQLHIVHVPRVAVDDVDLQSVLSSKIPNQVCLACSRRPMQKEAQLQW